MLAAYLAYGQTLRLINSMRNTSRIESSIRQEVEHMRIMSWSTANTNSISKFTNEAGVIFSNIYNVKTINTLDNPLLFTRVDPPNGVLADSPSNPYYGYFTCIADGANMFLVNEPLYDVPDATMDFSTEYFLVGTNIVPTIKKLTINVTWKDMNGISREDVATTLMTKNGLNTTTQ